MVRARRERGFALLPAIVAVVLIGIAGEGLHRLISDRLDALREDTRRASLRALNDAAVASTLARLAADPTLRGVPAIRFGGGAISSEVVPVGPGRLRVDARADFDGRTLVAHVVVEMGPAGPQALSFRRGAEAPPPPLAR